MKKAFTLIELLIVVAIIAILAAIAVPNFLEAQVRAKVGRAKADLRSLSIAIESYAVDNGRPAMGERESTWGNNGISDLRVWCQYTTPIAYLSSIPRDPFCTGGAFMSGGWLGGAFFRDRCYQYQTTPRNGKDQKGAALPAAFVDAAKLGLRWVGWSLGPLRTWNLTNQGIWPTAAAAGIPDRKYSATTLGYPGAFYDSTNGTTSYGWIIRSNMLSSL